MTAECGVAGPDSRITGGSESAPHKYPWMASIFMHKGADTFFCGGTLVSILHTGSKPRGRGKGLLYK